MASTEETNAKNAPGSASATQANYNSPEDHKKWYLERIPDDVAWPATRELLKSYSKIPEADVEEHVYKIRDRAWNVCDYPCIGHFRFLDLSIGQAPHYPEVLDRLKQGQRMLDIGCCFGQDERRLVADGAPSNNLYACDLRADFFELGYELFQDKSILGAHFFAADVFDSSNSELNALDGTVDIVNASAFFHLFDYEGQFNAATRVAKLLRKVPGSLIVGRQMGNSLKGDHYANRKMGGDSKYRHDKQTWEQMWKEVGEKTGTKWEVDVWWMELQATKDASLNEKGSQQMKYSCRML